ncbi:MAG: hypothetical protein J6L83_05910 [Clostridia bacterium]|nr:hypothetical protein [Clostridia bacterium]
MSEKYTFEILGGDRRQSVVAKELLALGHSVRAYGVGDLFLDVGGIELCLSYEKAIMGCDAVILPLPVSRDGETLNISSVEKKESPKLCEVVKNIAKCENAIVVGGLIPESMRRCALDHSVQMVDYYGSEELQRKNALPSAEGAIMIAMENTETVLEGASVLVSGYGRIGRLIAEKIKMLGAEVSVAARRDEVLCEISMSGYGAVRTTNIDEMSRAVQESEIIFNTVPEIIFAGKTLDCAKDKPLYIEIASSPGGIDLPRARELGYKIISAPSLPGKYAPQSAGKYIFETIRDILIKRGMKL